MYAQLHIHYEVYVEVYFSVSQTVFVAEPYPKNLYFHETPNYAK